MKREAVSDEAGGLSMEGQLFVGDGEGRRAAFEAEMRDAIRCSPEADPRSWASVEGLFGETLR